MDFSWNNNNISIIAWKEKEEKKASIIHPMASCSASLFLSSLHFNSIILYNGDLAWLKCSKWFSHRSDKRANKSESHGFHLAWDLPFTVSVFFSSSVLCAPARPFFFYLFFLNELIWSQSFANWVDAFASNGWFNNEKKAKLFGLNGQTKKNDTLLHINLQLESNSSIQFEFEFDLVLIQLCVFWCDETWAHFR